MTTDTRNSRLGVWTGAFAIALAALLGTLLAAGPARADYGIASFEAKTAKSDDSEELRAAWRPDRLHVDMAFDTTTYPGLGLETPDGHSRNVIVDLPVGLVGNPTAVPTCTVVELAPANTNCPVASQIGTVDVTLAVAGNVPQPQSFPVFNLKPEPGQAARIGFNTRISNSPVLIEPDLRAGDYGITAKAIDIPEGGPFTVSNLRIWGVPADPSHDFQRGPAWTCDQQGGCIGGGNAAGIEPVPYLANPTSCAGPLTYSLGAIPWWPANQSPVTASSSSSAGLSGCEQVPFDPAISLAPTQRRADSPTGMDVELKVPQNQNPATPTTAHLRRAVVRLPEGFRVSPSAADGLGDCSLGAAQLNSEAPTECPDSSKIADVEVETPLLAETLTGGVYVAKQDDPATAPAGAENPFDSLLALYLVAESAERGLSIKLPGEIGLDPATGQVTATFDNAPQLPFDVMRMRFKSGSRAPLTTPSQCGTYTTEAELTSWSGKVVSLSSPMTIDQGCAQPGFDPGFSAGSVQPLAGEFSPFAMRGTRDGANQGELGRIDVRMPEGLLAKLKGVEKCTGAQLASAAGRSGRAAQGAAACPAGSQVGTTTVGAGSGPTPFYPRLPGRADSGRAFLTEGYKGAPYGLAIEVPAVAGPLDLGTVTVRAAVHVDRDTAQVSVLSDPLPRILEGIPLDVRDVRVDVDRADFTVNPTSCAQKAVDATIHAQDGATAARTARYKVGGCAGLELSPKLALRLTGKGQRGRGAHPGIKAVMTQSSGQANLRKARVVLPKEVVLDAKRSADPKRLCSYEGGLRSDCPASSKIGSAVVQTPLLSQPLRGAVYFVQGVRFDKRTGNRIRTLPTLLVQLRGEIAIDLRAASSTTRGGRLVTTFADVPDAPVSKFTLQVASGKRAILTNNRNVCRAGKLTTDVEMDGHNGRQHDFAAALKTTCAKAKKKKGAR